MCSTYMTHHCNPEKHRLVRGSILQIIIAQTSSGHMCLTPLTLRSVTSKTPSVQTSLTATTTMESQIINRPRVGVNQSSPYYPLLPIELWLLIGFFIKRKSDFVNLCRSSKILQTIYEPFIYRSLVIRLDLNSPKTAGPVLEETKLAILSQTIRTPRIADMVMGIQIYFARCPYSDGIFRPVGACGCRRNDNVVGRILVSLNNLQILHFNCRGCHQKPDKAHLYLHKLQTMTLKEASLECRCYDFIGLVPHRFLLSPCFCSITTLRLLEHFNTEKCLPSVLKVIERIDYLPHLKELMCADPIPFGPLFRKGIITHLLCEDRNKVLPTILSNCPASLFHLHTEHIELVVAAILEDHSPYRNLRHLGYFHFDMANVSITSSAVHMSNGALYRIKR
jgi:hypothetical protein